VTSVPNRFYQWIRHPTAHASGEEHAAHGFELLHGHKYCLLISYRRSGEAVPTPVWFGLAKGSVYVRTEANLAKVKRIRNDSRVRVAPCTVRGKPVGPAADGHARVLDGPDDEAKAEAALQANYGLGRKIYQRVGGAFRVEVVYLEVTPG
jgi:PPOX class probable F420-dependent enzyme